MLAYTALYLRAAYWGREMQVSEGITPWFPAVGLTPALLVGFGPSYLPVAFVAGLISGGAGLRPVDLQSVVLQANHALSR
jgi:hypothetical protein